MYAQHRFGIRFRSAARLAVTYISAVIITISAWSGVAAAQGITSTPSSTRPLLAGRYAALGDSVAAGLGLPAGSYTTPRDIQCGRSVQGYPTSVAAKLHMQLINVTCSGATVGDLFTQQRVDGPNITAQLDIAFAQGTPGLISITAGANDVHWRQFIQACYVADCTAAGYDAAAHAYLSAMRVKLAVALADIYRRAQGQPPTVVITGYYTPLSMSCASQQSTLTAAEITWLSSQTAALNTAIQRIAYAYPFVRYAPVSFSGHDLCSAQPWVQTAAAAAPFHPTAAGQQAIAKAVFAAATARR